MSENEEAGREHVIRHGQDASVEVTIWPIPGGTDRDWVYIGPNETYRIVCDCGEEFDSEEEAIEHLKNYTTDN